MGYWQIVPIGVVTELRGLADVFQASREAFFRISDDHLWQPATGSPAERDKRELSRYSIPSTIGSPASSGGFELVSDVIGTYMLTAAGHVGALGSLHSTSEVLFSPGALTRTILECCARAVWVLGDSELNEPPESRLARAYLEHVLSAEEAKKTSGRLGGKDTEIYRSLVVAWQASRRSALSIFPGATKEDLGAGCLGGQSRPGPGAGVSWMYKLFSQRGGSSITTQEALGMYDLLSNVTHPTLYPVREMRVWSVVDRVPRSRLQLDSGFLRRQAAVAVAAFYLALGYVASYHDWPRRRLDELARVVDRYMPTLLTG